MQRTYQILLASGVLAFSQTTAALELKDDKAKLSYSLGYNIGSSLKQQQADIDPEVMKQALQDALGGNEAAISEKDMQDIITDFRRENLKRQMAERKAAGTKQLEEGKKFLEENKKKEGVVALPSGLQYKILTPGTGIQPKATDEVTVHYRGTLLDGTEFDSSYKRNEPVTFRLDKVIKGWQEGLQLMKEGAKWQLFIPSELAYGDRGTGGAIPPHATLTFEVELQKVMQIQEMKK